MKWQKLLRESNMYCLLSGVGHIGYQAVDLYQPKNAIAGHILPILVRGGNNDNHDLVTAKPRCEEFFCEH